MNDEKHWPKLVFLLFIPFITSIDMLYLRIFAIFSLLPVKFSYHLSYFCLVSGCIFCNCSKPGILCHIFHSSVLRLCRSPSSDHCSTSGTYFKILFFNTRQSLILIILLDWKQSCHISMVIKLFRNFLSNPIFYE